MAVLEAKVVDLEKKIKELDFLGGNQKNRQTSIQMVNEYYWSGNNVNSCKVYMIKII